MVEVINVQRRENMRFILVLYSIGEFILSKYEMFSLEDGHVSVNERFWITNSVNFGIKASNLSSKLEIFAMIYYLGVILRGFC